MKKRYTIKNYVNYSLDMVNCFERAIINQLYFKNKYYGDFFLMLSKLYQFYFLKQDENYRYEIIKLFERLLGCKYHNIKNIEFSNVKKFLDDRYLPIIGGNLISLFYSDYYKEYDWPHWFVMTGCDIERKLYYFFDDIQYAHVDYNYGDVCLTNKVTKMINRKYNSIFDKKWSCFFLEIIDEVSLHDALKSILLLYFEFDVHNKNSYPQVNLMKELVNINKNRIAPSNLFEEFKKKLFNMNKYRLVFFQELANYMKYLNYSSDLVLLLIQYNQKLEKLWDTYVTSNILKIVKCEETDCEILDDIVFFENKVRDLLLDFSQFLLSEISKNAKNNKCICKNIESNLNIENNIDDIVFISKNTITFNLNKGKIYNWWFDDYAPKVILTHDFNFNRNFKVHTKLKINEGFTQNNFQAGIFLRTGSCSLFCALDVRGMFILDEIGKLNKSSYFLFSNNVELTVEKNGEMIMAQIKDSKSNEIKLEWYLISNEKMDIGFACKTWGDVGTVNIEFYDYYFQSY